MEVTLIYYKEETIEGQEEPKITENVIATAYTGENGEYNFYNIDIDPNEKENYIVRFSYKDDERIKQLKELTCEYKLAVTYEISSKVEEVGREELDNAYQSVKATGAMVTNNNTSKSQVSGNKGTFDVNYNTHIQEGRDTYSIAKNVETNQSQLSSNGKTRNVNKFEGYENYNINKITATTQIAKDSNNYGVLGIGRYTVNSIKTNGIEEISDINCGLVRREQVNLSVATDIYNVQVSVNGYKNTYEYNQKSKYVETTDEDGNVISAEDNFRLDVKSKKWGYYRNMYASDIVYNGEGTCKVTITYAMTIRNNSNTLTAKVNRLNNYHNSNYTIINSRMGENDLTWTTSPNNTNGYKVSHTDNLPQIEANKAITLYVQYELSNSAVISILSGDLSLENIIEIEDYTSYYGKDTFYRDRSSRNTGAVYASIDGNSAPGNAIPGNNKTYEDDTMASPTLTMQLTTNERTIEGSVFEDATFGGDTYSENIINADQERIGDGKFTDIDRTVGNVIVELYKYKPENYSVENPIWYKSSEGDIAYMWTKADENDGNIEKSGKIIGKQVEARVKTDKDGKYKISGIVPGEYILKFTYGNGNVIYKNVDGENEDNEVKELNRANEYKSTIIASETIKNALERNPESPMWYKTKEWYKTEENETIENKERTSVAVDDEEAYNSLNTEAEEKTITNKSQSESIIESKSAYTAPMNIKFELVDDNNDGIADTDKPTSKETVTTTRVIKENQDGTKQVETVLEYNNHNIDFGIVKIAKQGFDLVKDISHIKLTLGNSNGQVLIDGDPRSDNLKYVKKLDNTPFTRANTLNMEIENNLIIGSTLEITYSVKATNKSELNYATSGYYYYGTKPENENRITQGIKFSKVIDYLDNNLTFDSSSAVGTVKVGEIKKEDNDYYIKIKEGTEKLDVSTYLLSDGSEQSKKIIENASKFHNILILESNEKVGANQEQAWQYKASKLLEARDSLEFTNYAEVIELTTNGEGSSSNILGNLDPNPDPVTEVDKIYGEETDYFSEQVSITSPTGANRNIVVFVIGMTALVVLTGGIWLIKKKVL